MIRLTIELLNGENRIHFLDGTEDAKPDGTAFLSIREAEGHFVLYNTKYVRTIEIQEIGSKYVG